MAQNAFLAILVTSSVLSGVAEGSGYDPPAHYGPPPGAYHYHYHDMPPSYGGTSASGVAYPAGYHPYYYYYDYGAAYGDLRPAVSESCLYDAAWSMWALDTDACRTRLYRVCESPTLEDRSQGSGVACSCLDAYYSRGFGSYVPPMPGPCEASISGFLERERSENGGP